MVESLEGRTFFAATLDAGFAESTHVSGFDTPTAQAFAPDGRLFVLEKAGSVRIVSAGGQLQPTPLVTLSSVDTTQDRGLVGLTFDANFAQNNYLYLWYTRTDGSGTRNRLSRFTVSGNASDPATERVIIESPMTTNIHTGGAMGFGADGYLYLGVGEGGVSTTAQDLTDLRGKILRIDPSIDAFPNDPLRNYGIPLSNPFYGSASARGEIYAYGMRNPFTGQMRPGTSQFYVADVGQEAFEELNIIQAGGNYGWPAAEGASAPRATSTPIYQYSHTGFSSAAITGVAFNTGNQFPLAYANNVFFGDYLNGFMRRVDPSTNGVAGFGTSIAGAVDIDFGPDGSLYYLSVSGNGFAGTNRPVYKISYVGSANRAPTAVAAATTATNGLAPLTVSFTGQGSTDPDNDALTYTWTFGDGQAGTGRDVSHVYARQWYIQRYSRRLRQQGRHECVAADHDHRWQSRANWNDHHTCCRHHLQGRRHHYVLRRRQRSGRRRLARVEPDLDGQAPPQHALA
jgi:glucose/arabinose dehydrogenase